MDIAIMIEGQDGLTWDHWKRIVHDVEELGFAGLYRSDHFTNANPPDKASLELWTSLTWLAGNTERIEFGPLVTPASFRHPVFTAWMAKEVDLLSNQRLLLGLGAGWQEREHEAFGFDLLPIEQRFARFEEALQVITGLLHGESPIDFEGNYYSLKDASLRPDSPVQGRPPISIGGKGPKYTLPLVAQYADEWNGVYVPPHRFNELNGLLDEMLEGQNRPLESVRRSLMTGLVYGRDRGEMEQRASRWNASADELKEHGLIVGVGDQIIKQIQAFADAGVQRIMLQWLYLDDLDGIEQIAQLLLPVFPT